MWGIIGIILSIGGLLVWGAWQGQIARVRSLSRGLLISYTMIVAMLVGGELYFRYVFAQSENILSRATLNWLERHWDTNALGYRDREWSPEDWQDKETVIVIGDSFTAGWGLEDPTERFSDVLASQLGEAYAVLNLGVYGTGTYEQLERLQNHPLEEPDVIVLQYFLNDISYTGLRLGIQLQAPDLPTWARDSALGNFLYVRFVPLFTEGDDWEEWDFDAYDNVTIWDLHREEIEAFIDHAESVDARLIVVIFPNMLQPFRSIPYVDRVAQVFEDRGHTDILKLFDEAEAWPIEDRIISNRDTHPSAAFHRYVGEELYRRYFSDSPPAS